MEVSLSTDEQLTAIELEVAGTTFAASVLHCRFRLAFDLGLAGISLSFRFRPKVLDLRAVVFVGLAWFLLPGSGEFKLLGWFLRCVLSSVGC